MTDQSGDRLYERHFRDQEAKRCLAGMERMAAECWALNKRPFAACRRENGQAAFHPYRSNLETFTIQ